MYDKESKLFRKESIENNSHKLLGDVILIRPVSFWVLTGSISIVVIIVILFLAHGTFIRKETVVGFLVPDRGAIKVYPPYAGIVDRKNIEDGHIVKKGDDLIKISTQRGSNNSLTTNQQIINQTMSRQKSLKIRIQDESLLFMSESKRLALLHENLEQELIQFNQQLEIKQKQLDLAHEQWMKSKKLKLRNLITENELVGKYNNYLTIQSSYENLERQKISKTTEKNNLNKQIEQLPFKNRNLLQELNNTLGLQEERLIELEGRESYVIKAPIDGMVTSLQAYPGQSVSLNSSLLTIIPTNTILYAELFLPTKAIGFVKEGQKVRFYFDAFPYQRFGLYEGTVDEVARALINPNEIDINLPVNEPVYRVKVSLDSQFVKAYGDKFSLQSGMSIVASILLEERSLGEWLFAPIYSLKGKF